MLVGIISYFYFQDRTEISELKTIAEERSVHESYLKNSPYKKTLQLSKAERKSRGIPPNKYYEREWELTMNPGTGSPEPNKVFEIQKQRNNLKAKAPGEEKGVNEWIERGPNNVGGRTRMVLFDPNDATNNRVFAGGVSGGLHVKDNIASGRFAWNLVSGVPSNMNISCITVDPNNSNIWYIGTGEQYTSGAAVGNGVYKTTDGGTTWTNIPVQLAGGGDLGSSTSSFLAGIYYINDIIAWDNNGSTEVFMGVGAHYYGDASNPNNLLGMQSSGLYKTTDDGSNWSRIESSNMEFEYNGIDFYFIPNDFEISADNSLWMGTITTPGIGGGGGGRVFTSTDGALWSQEATLEDSNRVELAVSSSDAAKIYALTQGTTTSGPHIYATTDTFTTITELAKPDDADDGIPANDFTRGQAFYDLVIEVDPSDDAIVYVGGIDLFRTDQGTNTNVASEWVQISQWGEKDITSATDPAYSYVHADQHAFTFNPGDSNKAVIGCDGGIFYASNLTNTLTSNVAFSEINLNYTTTQFYYGGYGPSATNELIIAGAQDNGTQFINDASAGSNASERIYSGDGAYSTIDKDGDFMIASYVYSNHVYFSLPYTGVGYTIENNSDEGDFINPGGLDHNLNILFANGSEGSAKRINRYALGSTSAVKEQLTNNLLTGSPTAFKVSPFITESTTLLVGTDDSKLLKLINANGLPGNISWEEITGPSFIGSVSSIEFGETENDILVTFHNYGVTSIWYTSNSGVSWKNKEGDLPDMPVKCILQNPLARNEVIVGTELGVWVSKNFNEDSPTWTSSFNGMRDVKVVDLDLRTEDNAILATSHGRGTFTGSFTSETDPTFTISSTNSVLSECKPDDAVFNLDYTANGGYSSSTTLTASGAPDGATVTFSLPTVTTTQSLTMTVGNLSDATSGEYTITVTGTGAKTISTDVVLIVNASVLGVTNLALPINGTGSVAINNETFSWDELEGASSYQFEIAANPNFNTILETSVTSNNSFVPAIILDLNTIYYWRVKGLNDCVEGDYSEAYSFQTAPLNSCNPLVSNETVVPIPDGTGANTPGADAISIINIPTSFSVSDVNVSIDITHTYIQDLVITLISPTGTEVVLFDRECAAEDDINVIYDDQASDRIICAGPVTGTSQPANSLGGFNEESAQGNWTLKVQDFYNGDSGDINSWSIELCEPETNTNSTVLINPLTVGTNSIYVLKQTDMEASNDGTAATEHIFLMSQEPTIGNLRLNNASLSLGETFTQDDINNNKITYVNTSSINATDSFKVDITNSTGGFSPNQEMSINIDNALSVDDFFAKAGISIFPTVSNGEFSISSSKGIGETKIELYSITGQKVYSTQLNFNSGNIERINVGQLASGVYILSLATPEIRGSKKLIIK